MATTDPRKTGFQIAPFLGSFAWASAPSASASGIGATFRASDVGISPGMRFVSDGTSWIPDGAQILGRSAVAVSGAADTAENILATVTVPANLLGLNGGLLAYSTWSYTNSANVKTLRLRFGGIGGTQYLLTTRTTEILMHDLRRIRNRNSASSQVGGANSSMLSGLGASASALITSANDTTAAVDLVLTGAKASAGETLTLENYEVWLTP